MDPLRSCWGWPLAAALLLVALPLCQRCAAEPAAGTTAGINSGAGSPQAAFMRYFGTVTEEQRQQLLEDVDTILTVGSAPPGQLLRHVHEYEGVAGFRLGTEVIPQLSQAGNSSVDVVNWARRIMAGVPNLDASLSFSMLRRTAAAALLRTWLAQRRSLTADEDASVKHLFRQVRPQHASRRIWAHACVGVHCLQHAWARMVCSCMANAQ